MWKRFSRQLPERKTLFILAAIIVIAAFMRLYRISDYMTFLGDEGRDVLVAKHILEGHLTFLGPRASAGDFYLGPAYYYFMAPFLFLFNLDPVGPAVMIALFGILTVFLVYYITSKFVTRTAGLIAASLYAVSPLVLVYSRSSWNPNLMPPVTLIMIYLLYLSLKSPSIKKYMGVGFLFGIAMQLHYIEIFVGIIIAFLTFVGTIVLDKKQALTRIARAYFQIFIGFVLGLSPFIAFEIKNNFPNFVTIFHFIFSSGSLSQGVITDRPFLEIIKDVFFRLFGRLLLTYPTPDMQYKFSEGLLTFWGLVVIVLALTCVVAITRIKDKLAKVFLVSWLFFGVILFGFYKKPIHDYYFEFMFPLPFILFGNTIAQGLLFTKKRITQIFLWGLVGLIFLLNLYGIPFRYEPNRQKNQIKDISNFVLSKTNNKPFNFALLTPGNSDHGYRYFFEIAGKSPITLENTINDPERKTVTDQLLIVCEDINCKPLGNSLFEVAGFGRAEIVGEWNFSVVKVYRLVHYTGNE